MFANDNHQIKRQRQKERLVRTNEVIVLMFVVKQFLCNVAFVMLFALYPLFHFNFVSVMLRFFVSQSWF